MGWSMKDIEQLHAAGKIKGFKTTGKNMDEPRKKKVHIPQKEATGLKFIKQQLDKNDIPYTTEYHFAKPRKFRFDIALPALKLAFEYEGIFAGKSRHTSMKGYTRDATKYNIAAANGWKVYRYTAMNYKDFESDLKTIIG